MKCRRNSRGNSNGKSGDNSDSSNNSKGRDKGDNGNDVKGKGKFTNRGKHLGWYKNGKFAQLLELGLNPQLVETTHYVNDVANSASQVLMTMDGQENYTATYSYGLERIKVEPMDDTRPDSQISLYYLHDGLGSTRQLVRSNGAIRDHYNYDEFGAPAPGAKLSEDGRNVNHNTFGYTGELWDEEDDLLYLRSRYYAPQIGRFMTRDTFPGYAVNPLSMHKYTYVENNPVNFVDPLGFEKGKNEGVYGPHPKYIIIDGKNNNSAGRVILSSDLRMAGFVARHPAAAAQIGKADPGKGKTDITNNSIRFSTNDLGLQENSAHEGSQVNAFRHALWQASITKQLGIDIAVEVGYAHEENPYAIDGINDFNNIRFTTLSLADEAIDLLNNKIGREIGKNMGSYYMDDMAIATLDYYHEKGLWVAKKQSDGNYAIVQQKLSDIQYKVAYNRLSILDENGFTKEQGEKWYKYE